MDVLNYPLILHCEAMKQGENQQNRYELLVAANVDNTLKLDEEISQAFSEQGYIFMYAEQAVLANHYFESGPQYNAEAMFLCRQLSKAHPIAFQQINIVSSSADNLEPLNYIDISAFSTPKNIDKALAFWEREWINPALKELLFAPNLPAHSSEEHTAIVRTYLIIDATLYSQQYGVFDLALIDDCPIMCMFTGDAAENLKWSAPYLLDMTLSEQAYQDES